MNCPNCGASGVGGRKFCGDCGTPLPWTCAACGSENPPDKRFCGDCGAAAADRPRPSKSRSAAVPPVERRHLTVMFVDLVGSTAIGAGLDPEEMREVIAAFQGSVTGLVTRFGGFVARHMGDGVLAYFGYPQAHEDDSEQAVSCGLVMVQAVAKLDTLAGPAGTLRARVGIATGVVVVGDVIGSGSSLETPVVGVAPNLAARLQAIAQPGTVMIDETTRSLTGGLFVYQSVGPLTLKGWNDPVPAWSVVAQSSVDSRFAALRFGQGALIDRVEEMDLLLRRWKQATTGSGNVVLLLGEPGIGKSRLIAALEQTIADASNARLRFSCSPHHRDTPLYPVVRQFERAARFQRGDTPSTKLEKLRRLLAANSGADADLGIVADLLSIRSPQDNPQSPIAPQRLKEMTFAAIFRQLEKLAGSAPILLVVEDIHWADPTTLDLLDRLIAFVERLPILVLVTTRPEIQLSWASKANVAARLLNALDQKHAALLIGNVSGATSLPDNVIDRIIAHADGVPLFIEELTKTVIERGDNEPLSSIPNFVPATLNASLMGRLDRLAAGKEVAQIGSVIGREFSFEMLHELSGLPTQRLMEAVRELAQAGIAIEHGDPPDATYTFKHALVQDAAYGSMLRERRRSIHLSLAQLLEKDTVGNVEPQLIAWHFAHASAPERAIDYYLKAAERATGRFALGEMVNQLREGLRQLKGLPDSDDTRRRELVLQIALGRALIDHEGGAGERVQVAFERARQICLELDEPTQLIRVHDGLTNFYFAHFDLIAVLGCVEEMRTVGQRTGNAQAILLAHRSGGFANLLLGRFEQAHDDLRRLIHIYVADRDSPHTALTARDPKVFACTSLGICLTVMGHPTAGLVMTQAGIEHAENLDHTVSLIFGLRRACVRHMIARDYQAVIDLSERLAALSGEYETFKGRIDGSIFYSLAKLQSNWDAALIEQLLGGIERLDAAKNWILLPFFMACAAETIGNHGDFAQATALLDRAAALISVTNEQWCEPEIIRLQALFGTPAPQDAVELLHSALRKANQQGAKLWELRCAASLANIWRSTGEHAAAEAVLAPVYGWFTEGFETTDLAAAHALLQDKPRLKA